MPLRVDEDRRRAVDTAIRARWPDEREANDKIVKVGRELIVAEERSEQRASRR